MNNQTTNQTTYNNNNNTHLTYLKNYKTMCEQSTELQQLWKPQQGDRFWCTIHGKLTFVGEMLEAYYYAKAATAGTKSIWLPYDYQLQQILQEDTWNYFYFNSLVANEYRFLQNVFPYSTEQIALFRLMKERFNKSWNCVKKEWVII